MEDKRIDERIRDRRRGNGPYAGPERRAGDRRAQRLEPTRGAAGVAIVVDSWPLMRAGVRQLLSETALRVAADAASAANAITAVDDRLDLAVLGVTDEPLLECVDLIRRVPGPEGNGGPRILVMLERVEADVLRHLLAAGVEGVLQRTADLEELVTACKRLLAGERVLSGAALTVLAGAGPQGIPDGPAGAGDGLLTPKEKEVLGHLAQHRSNAEIAEAMCVSAATVKTHLSNIYGKLGVTSRREAVFAGLEQGLLV